MGGCQDASVVSRVMCLCVVSSVLLCRFYYVVGGCQGVAMWLPGCCYVVARMLPGHGSAVSRVLCVVARVLLCRC